MRIPKDLLNASVFLGGRDGHGALHYRATACCVGLPTTRTRVGWPCLVTARHNIRAAMREYGNIWVRVNCQDGTAKDIEITREWEYPDDEGCDLALTPFPVVRPEHDTVILPIPASWFVTDELVVEREIGPGEDLVAVGLFSSHVGSQRNLPIVRSGIIASMPFESLIDEATGLPYDAYLAEVRSIGGLSGSPVFIVLNPFLRQRDNDVGQIVDQQYPIFSLLGVIRGHWNSNVEPDFGELDFGESQMTRNSGVAIVTPISEVLSLFERDQLVKYKREWDEMWDQSTKDE